MGPFQITLLLLRAMDDFTCLQQCSWRTTEHNTLTWCTAVRGARYLFYNNAFQDSDPCAGWTVHSAHAQAFIETSG